MGDSNGGSISQSIAKRVAGLRDRFESEWRAGRSPHIEDFLAGSDEVHRTALLRALLSVEIELCVREGQPVTLEAYLQRFPQQADIIREILGSRTSDGPEQNPPGEGDENATTLTWKRSVTETARSKPESTKPVPPKQLGRFALQKVLGQGAYGTVYLAHDPQLDRQLALKVPKSGTLGDEHDVQRFLREARAAAQLRHPCIVPVFEAGKIGETYYIAAGHVAGTTLRKRIKQGPPFTPRDAARLISQLAAALHYAHNKGIIHRDVKPENIMLAEDGEPQIMDFGLARRDEGEQLRTQEGARMGTPAYMSPEQAAGRSHLADARSDLWALGVILYELLTGRRPFDGEILAVLNKILEQEPAAPRRLNRTIPRDLETICLKCLAKDPAQRYATCDELSHELERWLRGEPIAARRTPPWERAWRWARRRPVQAGMSAAIVFVTGLAGILGMSALSHKEEASLRKTDLDRVSQHSATTEKRLESTEMELEEKQSEVQSERSKKQAAEDLAVRREYRKLIASALQSQEAGNTQHAIEVLGRCPEALRHWEWHYLVRSIRPDGLDGTDGTLSPDGSRVATIGITMTGQTAVRNLTVWDLEKRAAIYQEAARPDAPPGTMLRNPRWSPDGRSIAVVSDKTSYNDGLLVEIRDSQTGKVVRSWQPLSAGVNSLAWSHDSRRLAIHGWNKAGVTVVNVDDGTPLWTTDNLSVTGVCWSPDDQRLAIVGSFRASIKEGSGLEYEGPVILDARNGEFQATMKRPYIQQSVAWSRDGRRLASVGQSGTEIAIWEVEQNQGHSSPRVLNDSAPLLAVDWSEQGELASMNYDGAVRIWNVDENRCVRTLAGNGSPGLNVGFARQGSRVFSANRGAKVFLFDALTGETRYSPKRLKMPVRRQIMNFNESGDWSPDGSMFFGLWLGDSQVRAFSTETGLEIDGPFGEFLPYGVWFSPRGLHAFLNYFGTDNKGNKNIKGGFIWDQELRKRSAAVDFGAGYPRDVSWSRDGRRFSTLAINQIKASVLRAWDTETGSLLFSRDIPEGIRGFGLSPRGTEAAIFHLDGRMQIVAVPDGADVCVLPSRSTVPWKVPGPNDHISSIRVIWSPDGRHLLAQYPDALVVWHTETWTEQAVFRHESGTGTGAGGGKSSLHAPIGYWSQAGRELAISINEAISIYSVDDWSQARTLPLSARAPVVWSPDDRRLVTAGRSSPIRQGNLIIWDAQDHEEVFQLDTGFLIPAMFSWSPDGRCLRASDAFYAESSIWRSNWGDPPATPPKTPLPAAKTPDKQVTASTPPSATPTQDFATPTKPPEQVPPKYTTVHGLTSADFRTWLDQCPSKGLRPVFINGTDGGGAPTFAAIAVNDGWRVPSVAHIELTSAEYLERFKLLSARSYRPISVSGYAVGAELHYAAVWIEAEDRSNWSSIRMGHTTYEKNIADRTAKGLRPFFISGYPDSVNSHRFAVLWIEDRQTPWEQRCDLTEDALKTTLDHWSQQGFRPISVSGYQTAEGLRFAVFAVRDGRPSITRHGLSSEQLQQALDANARAGYRPLAISGYLDRGHLRYAALWENPLETAESQR